MNRRLCSIRSPGQKESSTLMQCRLFRRSKGTFVGLWRYLSFEYGVGLFSIRSHQYFLATRADEERAADAFAACPWARGDRSYVAGASNPETVLACDRSVVIAPELAVGFANVVVLGRD